MSFLKTVARVPWRWSEPVRRRVVFRMLHYGRHLLEPVGASLQRLEAQVRALDEKVERGEAVQRAIEGHTAERVDMARARLDAELRGLAEAHRAAASRELGSLSATLGGLVRDADRILGRLEDLASASNPRRAATLAGATIDVAAFASSPATMVSYAQNREDVLLQRLFPRDHLGFYVDVGAGDPVEFSVTKHFYDRGWHGINLEPAAHYFDRLVAQRPRDVNLKIGAWDSDGELDLLEATTPTGLSTFLEDVARSGGMAGIEFRRRRVPVSTLVSVLGAYAPDVIDFLKVDVEGAESRVLAGNDWGRFRPRVVVVESTRPGSTAQTHEEWETDGGDGASQRLRRIPALRGRRLGRRPPGAPRSPGTRDRRAALRPRASGAAAHRPTGVALASVPRLIGRGYARQAGAAASGPGSMPDRSQWARKRRTAAP